MKLLTTYEQFFLQLANLIFETINQFIFFKHYDARFLFLSLDLVLSQLR